jgi:hypothetical protein
LSWTLYKLEKDPLTDTAYPSKSLIVQFITSLLEEISQTVVSFFTESVHSDIVSIALLVIELVLFQITLLETEEGHGGIEKRTSTEDWICYLA